MTRYVHALFSHREFVLCTTYQGLRRAQTNGTNKEEEKKYVEGRSILHGGRSLNVLQKHINNKGGIKLK